MQETQEVDRKHVFLQLGNNYKLKNKRLYTSNQIFYYHSLKANDMQHVFFL